MKQKKKMLLAMAALSAVAVGVGTTSTFAWFGVTNTLAALQTSDASGISVARSEVAVSENLAHVLNVTAASTNPVTGLAKFNDTLSSPKLSTGYIDAGGQFHEVTTGHGKTLSSTFTLTIQIDWGVLQSTDSTADHYNYGWNSDGTKYTENNVTYTKADVLSGLTAQTALKVLIKPATDSRIRFYGTDASNTVWGDLPSVDSSFAEGKVNNINDDALTYKGYYWFDTVTLAGLANAAKTDTGANVKKVTTDATAAKYYIYGGDGNFDDRNNATVSGPIEVKLIN